MEDSSCDGCATIRSRIRASNAIAASRTFQRPRRSHAHLRFCLFISSTLALLIDTARFKLCACLVSRSRLLFFHQEGGGKKEIRSLLARFPRRTNLFFLEVWKNRFVQKLELVWKWERVKGKENRTRDVSVDWNVLSYFREKFKKTSSLINLIVFKYLISLYYFIIPRI